MSNLILMPRWRKFHTPPPPLQGFFAAKTGSPTNPGTEVAPWTPAYALAGASGLLTAPNTLWLRAGVYRGPRFPVVSGIDATTRVVVRAVPGERVIVERGFESSGSYITYRDLQFQNTSPQRVSSQADSNPTDIPERYASVGVNARTVAPGSYNNWINCFFRDYGGGIGDPEGVVGTKWSGCLIHPSGWHAPDRGHGHIIYIQNDAILKVVQESLFLSAFHIGAQVGGTGAAKLLNMDFIGNVIAMSGIIDTLSGMQVNLELYGGYDYTPTAMRFLRFLYNHFYSPSTLGAPGSSVTLNLTGNGLFPMDSVTFEHNWIHGVNTQLNPANNSIFRYNKIVTGNYVLGSGNTIFTTRLPTSAAFSTNIVDYNELWTPAWGSNFPFSTVDGSGASAGYNTLAAFRSATGYELNGTLNVGRPTGSWIDVRPNPDEPGRAHVICYNWDNATLLAIDLSTIGLVNGDKYVVHHWFDPFGAPVASGIYSGALVSVLQTGMPSHPKAVGWDNIPASPPNNEFNVYIVKKVTDTTLPAAPSGLAATPGDRYDRMNLTWTRNSSDERGFQLERLQDPTGTGQTVSDWVRHEVFPAGATAGIATDLIELTDYTDRFRIRAYKEAGHSAPSNTAGATTIAAAGSIIVSDAFAGPPGTLLTAHEPEIGTGYAYHPTRPGTFIITDQNRLRQTDSQAAFALALDNPASVSCDAEIDVKVLTVETGQFYLYLGADSILDLGYLLRRQANSGTWEAWRFSSSPVSAQLGSSVSQTLTVGQSIHMMVRRRATTLSFWIDGSKIIGDITDGNLTAIGKVGIRSAINPLATFDNAHGYHFKNLKVTNA